VEKENSMLFISNALHLVWNEKIMEMIRSFKLRTELGIYLLNIEGLAFIKISKRNAVILNGGQVF